MPRCHRCLCEGSGYSFSRELELIVTRLKISSLRSLLAYVGPVGLQISTGNNFQLYWLLEAMTSRGQTSLTGALQEYWCNAVCIWRDWCSVIFTGRDVTEHYYHQTMQTQCKNNVLLQCSSRIIIALTNNMDSQKDMTPDLTSKGLKHCCTLSELNCEHLSPPIDFLNLNWFHVMVAESIAQI